MRPRPAPAPARAWLVFSVYLCALGCAGYRGGWESFPYVGATPPPPPVYRTPFEAQQRSQLVLPGLTLGVGINNQVRTYQREMYLYALPLSVDPRDVPTQTADPGITRITLRISGHDGDLVFSPQLARLGVGDEWASGIAGFEFGMWDASGQRVGSGGAWGYRATTDRYALTERERTYLLSIDFRCPVPPPESQNITLDLSRALHAAGKPEIPRIRFLPVRWKEGYT